MLFLKYVIPHYYPNTRKKKAKAPSSLFILDPIPVVTNLEMLSAQPTAWLWDSLGQLSLSMLIELRPPLLVKKVPTEQVLLCAGSWEVFSEYINMLLLII